MLYLSNFTSTNKRPLFFSNLTTTKEIKEEKKKQATMASDEDSAFISAMNMCYGLIQSAALKAAIELKLFEIIARANGRHVSAAEIATHFPSSSQHQDLASRIDRLLRLLANHSLLNCSYGLNNGEDTETEILYGISPIGKFFVGGQHNTTDGFLTFFPSFVNHPSLFEAGLNLRDAIIDKETDVFKKVHGISFYQYSQTDPTMMFNKAMADISNFKMRRILETYKGFEGVSTVVDVGGGNGQVLQMIVSKYPSIKAINFDLPQVIQDAPSYPGIEHVGGDMFESVPKGDTIILKYMCHNWSDEKNIKILKKCYEALPEKGKVVVIEFIKPSIVDTSQQAQSVCGLDNYILFLFDGRERNQKEYHSLCKRSGFSSFKLASLVCCALGVMEFYK